MGRVEDYDPEVNHASIMQHFSHPHPLEEEQFNLQNVPQGPVTLLCSGCKLPPSGTMYVCRPCNFTLHATCAKLPQMITHPSHPIHILTLLPCSLYPGGVFICDGCGHQSNGFNFHCQTCDFDLDVLCAIKPRNIKHQMHPCQLELTIKNPYGSNKGFVCDVCSKMGSKQWLYRCKSCSFDVHLDCAYATGPRVTMQPQPTIQNVHSFPGESHPQNQLQHQVASVIPNQVMLGAGTMGYQLQQGTQFQSPGVLMPNYQQPTLNQLIQASQGQMPNYQHSVGIPITQSAAGSMPTYQPPVQGKHQQQMVQGNQASMANTLMTATMQGLIEGAAQAVGQTLAETMISSGDGGGGDASETQN